MWPIIEPETEFIDGWHIRAICQHLEAVTEYKIKELLINEPPRHAKSIITCVMWPSWVWGKYPNKSFIFGSHTLSLAQRDSIKTRQLIESDQYKQVFKPDWHLREDQNTLTKFTNSKGGTRRAVSVGSTVTGDGADFCFISGTKVLTISGNRNIEDIKVGEQVWSYDVQSGNYRLNKVKNLFKRDVAEVVEARTSCGRKVICTPEHLFFTKESGYRALSSIKTERVILAPKAFTQRVYKFTYILYASTMFILWHSFSKSTLRLQKNFRSWVWRRQRILWQQMFKGTLQFQDKKKVRSMQDRKNRKQKQKILLILQKKNIFKASSIKSILKRIQAYKALNTIQRSVYLFLLLIKEKSSHPSHRRRQIKQLFRQLNNFVSNLSQMASCSFKRSCQIRSIKRCSGSSFTVYDIEVERDHNFFANDFLVHNCVVDDPNDAGEIYSESSREHVKFWYDKVLSTRVNDPNNHARVIIMQRLHEDDLSGHVLKTQDYEKLILPGEYNSSQEIKSKTALGFKDPRSKEGELLWPERWTKDSMQKLKKILGDDAEAQINQVPKTASGGLFKKEDWKRYEASPSDISQIGIFIDAAQKPGVSNDYTVIATWAQTPNGYYLLDLLREKTDAPLLEVLTIQAANKWRPDFLLIEDKSAGSSLIQYLRKETTLPVLAFDPLQRDKVVRASASVPSVRSGNCHLPSRIAGLEDGEKVNLVDVFIKEHETFPRAKHDDMVDTTSMMIEYFNKNNTSNDAPLILAL